MAQRTTADETLPREELAAYFKDLAAEFERGDEEVTVPVGNKNVARPTDRTSTLGRSGRTIVDA